MGFFSLTRSLRIAIVALGILAPATFFVVNSRAAEENQLIEAVRKGDRDAVQKLLQNHAAVNALETDGTTALHWAVRADDLTTAQLLLKAGSDVKAANRYGITPLSLAATNGSAAMIDLLLKVGADPNATVQGGQTIVMTAARTGNAAALKLLLDRNADTNAKESAYGETALMWAAAENHPEAAKLLIAHGADVNARSKKLEYPNDRFGLEAVVTVLPHGSWTPLMYAARQGSLGVVRALLDSKADVNLTDPDGTTALVIAIINQHYDAAALLVNRGANPNIGDSTGMAALYATVDVTNLGEIYGRPQRPVSGDTSSRDLMKVLLQHGAKVNAQLATSTLYRAHTPGEPLLGEGSTPLMRASKGGDAATMRLLLENGADPAITGKNHTTALMFAAGFGHGLGVFAKEYANEAGLLEATKVLLDRHVDVNAANDNGQTALHFAALSYDSIVKLLADNGAKLDARDKQGRTPLDFAMGNGGRGRGGQIVAPRESTIALLRRLMANEAAPNAAELKPLSNPK